MVGWDIAEVLAGGARTWCKAGGMAAQSGPAITLKEEQDRKTLRTGLTGRKPRLTFVLGILAVLACLFGAGVSATAGSAIQETVGGLAILTAAVLFVGAAVVEKLTAIDKRLLAIRSSFDESERG